LDPGTVTWTLGTIAPTLTNGADLADVQALVGLASTNVHLDGSLANGTDDEGFVLRFADGTRVKVKYAEYVRLHRLMTGVTERDVWRAVAFDDMMARRFLLKDIAPVLKCSKDELDKMLAAPYGALATIVDGTPDEFDAWIRSVEASLLERQNALLQEAVLAYTNVMALVGAGDRGTFARTLMETYGSHKTVMSLCFSLLDNKPLLPTIWKSLYPEASQPFREEEA
jgi:RNA ligase